MLVLTRSGSRHSTRWASCSDPDQSLFSESREELDQEEWATGRPLGHLEQLGVRFCSQDVGRHLCDPVGIQRSKCYLRRSLTLQELHRAANRRRSLARSKGYHPADRQRGQVGRQGAKSRGRPAVGRLDVVQADEERLLECGPFQQGLEVLQQPISLFRRSVGVRQCRTFEKGRSAFEQGLDQHRHLHHGVGWISHTGTDGMDSRPAIVATSAKRRLLPIPAAPSTTTIAPTPESSWSSCRPSSASSWLRPRRILMKLLSVPESVGGCTFRGPFCGSALMSMTTSYGPVPRQFFRRKAARPGEAAPDPMRAKRNRSFAKEWLDRVLRRRRETGDITPGRASWPRTRKGGGDMETSYADLPNLSVETDSGLRFSYRDTEETARRWSSCNTSAATSTTGILRWSTSWPRIGGLSLSTTSESAGRTDW